MESIENIQVHVRTRNPVTRFKYNASADKLDIWKFDRATSLKRHPQWHQHDPLFCEISAAFNTYHLARQSPQPYPYSCSPMIDAIWLKTIACTEVHAVQNNTQWNSRPMQIGNSGDRAIDDVLGHDAHWKAIAELIIPPEYRYLNIANIRANPKENIIAATAYILMNSCTFATATFVQDKDIKEVEISRDLNSYAKLAKATESTIDTLIRLNPEKHPNRLQLGDRLRYQPAVRKMMIYRTEPLDAASLAALYNVSGDAHYGAKLIFIRNLLENYHE